MLLTCLIEHICVYLVWALYKSLRFVCETHSLYLIKFKRFFDDQYLAHNMDL